MCCCGLVGSARVMLLLCQQTRREVGEENWPGKGVEAEQRGSTP